MKLSTSNNLWEIIEVTTFARLRNWTTINTYPRCAPICRPYRGSWNGPNTKDYTTRVRCAEQSSEEQRHLFAQFRLASLYGLYAKHILVQIYSLYIQCNSVGHALAKKTRKTQFSIRKSLVPRKLRSIWCTWEGKTPQVQSCRGSKLYHEYITSTMARCFP